MPPSRGDSATHSFQNAAKHLTAFHPPGPARSSSSNARASSGGGGFTTASSVHASTSKGVHRPVRRAASPSLSDDFDTEEPAPSIVTAGGTNQDFDVNEDEDEDEFGTAVDLEDLDLTHLAPVVSAAATGAATTTTSANGPLTIPADDAPRPSSETVRHVGDASPAPIPLSDDDSSSIPGIPSALLTRIMHESFTDRSNTGISRGGQEMMVRYVDLFVREAVARAAEGLRQQRSSRQQGQAQGQGQASRVDEDIWLGMEELEAVAPGLLMDF